MKNNQLRQVVFPFWRPYLGHGLCGPGRLRRRHGRVYLQRHPVLHRRAVPAGGSGRLKRLQEGPAPDLPAEKKAQRRQLWLGGFCCGTVLAIASNFQQAGLVPVPTAARPGSSPLCMWCWCRCSACSSGGGSACRCGSPWLSVGALYLLCIKGSFSLAPGACWCWYVPYAFPYISW